MVHIVNNTILCTSKFVRMVALVHTHEKRREVVTSDEVLKIYSMYSIL